MKWRRSTGGFTIVEVMITFAVSSVILAATAGVFNGRRAGTEFSQALYDLQSKIQSIGGQAGAAQLPKGQSFTCNINGGTGRPYLISPQNTPDSTATGNCIYMGKVVQVIPGADTIYIYPALGARTYRDSNGDLVPVDTIANANPEPALDNAAPPNWLLREDYTLLNGVTVKSAKIGANNAHLLAIYTTLYNTSNTSGNEVEAFARDTTFTSTTTDVNGTRLRDCIEYGVANSVPANNLCGIYQPLSSTVWTLCVQGNNLAKTATLTLKSTPTGLAIQTQQVAC
jgi:type II secretory pathway pseudopilin PulG